MDLQISCYHLVTYKVRKLEYSSKDSEQTLEGGAKLVTTSELTILDPVSGAVEAHATLSPRLDSLIGKKIGLFSNNKLNATKLLDLFGNLLAERYIVDDFVRVNYHGVRVMRPDEWVDIHECDAIVLTHGD